MTTKTKTDLRNEAEDICGCILDDCPISGDLLAKLRWIRGNGMGRGTDGEIDSSALDALIAKIETAFNRSRWLAYIAGDCGPNGGKRKV